MALEFKVYAACNSGRSYCRHCVYIIRHLHLGSSERRPRGDCLTLGAGRLALKTKHAMQASREKWPQAGSIATRGILLWECQLASSPFLCCFALCWWWSVPFYQKYVSCINSHPKWSTSLGQERLICALFLILADTNISGKGDSLVPCYLGLIERLEFQAFSLCHRHRTNLKPNLWYKLSIILPLRQGFTEIYFQKLLRHCWKKEIQHPAGRRNDSKMKCEPLNQGRDWI